MITGRNIKNSGQVSLAVDIKRKNVSGGRPVLKNIRAEFTGGDFVLILGGAGTGKTTLIKTILGESRATGRVLLDGCDLCSDPRRMRSMISVVPQFLTLRQNDTVRSTLEDSAAVRLGRICSREEQRRRVDEVLTALGIAEHADKYIGQLSGGQQKKAAVADQLIGAQQVFICDEPDSGLDAASRIQQMKILKSISRTGKIVMVISHEPDDAVMLTDKGIRTLFSKVVVLARSSKDMAGHLAFCGGIREALRFFGVERLQDIMLEINPVSEGGKGRADEFIGRYEAACGRAPKADRGHQRRRGS